MSYRSGHMLTAADLLASCWAPWGRVWVECVLGVTSARWSEEAGPGREGSEPSRGPHEAGTHPASSHAPSTAWQWHLGQQHQPVCAHGLSPWRRARRVGSADPMPGVKSFPHGTQMDPICSSNGVFHLGVCGGLCFICSCIKVFDCKTIWSNKIVNTGTHKRTTFICQCWICRNKPHALLRLLSRPSKVINNLKQTSWEVRGLNGF